MGDTTATQTPEYLDVVRKIREYDELVEHAAFIVGGCVHQHLMRIEIATTGHIVVEWLEVSSEYYSDRSLETQSSKIEPTLFLKTQEEIKAIWHKENMERMHVEQEKRERHDVMQRALNENMERAEYARLRAKYGE